MTTTETPSTLCRDVVGNPNMDRRDIWMHYAVLLHAAAAYIEVVVVVLVVAVVIVIVVVMTVTV